MRDDELSFITRLSLFVPRAVRDVWLIWFALSVLTTLPYVLAELRTPPGYLFSGVLTAYDDTFTYFAWMRQGSDGHLLMCDPFTSEPQRCEFFLPLWSLLGFISQVTHISLPITFHASRLLAALALLIVARGVASTVIRSKKQMRICLWLYAVSGGFGWLVYAVNNRGGLFGGGETSGSADLNLPEAIAFRSLFSQVHFSVGVVLVGGAILLVFRSMVEKKANRGLIAGLLVSLLAVVHPYMIFVVCAVAGAAFLTLPWLEPKSRSGAYYSSARAILAFGLGTLPGVAYAGYLNRSNEVLREWLRVTDTFSPPPWEYALGFGIVGAFAVVGFRLMWNRNAPYGRLLLIWAVVQSLMLYAPFSIQRRFVEGLQLPLAIAASVALFWFARKAFKGPAAARNRMVFVICAVFFAAVTNIGFAIEQMVPRAPELVDPRRYLDADLIAALSWLRSNSEPDAVLFSSYLTGNVAPSMTGLRVFLGHYAQTLRSDQKGVQVASFYSNAMTDETATKLFEEHQVRYVIYGPFERELSSTFAPPVWMTLVHSAGDVSVFEVSKVGRSMFP